MARPGESGRGGERRCAMSGGMRLWWSTCPKCKKAFVVAWELRHAKYKLICPFCDHRYLPEESAKIDERHSE
jgi:DNA-directed RNA polymerase subunit RPC12/RpoP